MGFFDSKKTTSNITNTTNTTKQNQQSGSLNLGENSKLSGDVNISNGVIEAVEEMANFGADAFNYGEAVSADAFGFGEKTIESNENIIHEGFGFAESVVSQQAETMEFALETQAASMNRTTDAIKGLASSVSSGGVTDAIGITKNAVYVVGGVVGLVVLLLVFRKG